MQKLQWITEQRKVNDLLPYSDNPRTISEKQLKDLKKSLIRFNLVEIPAIDTDNRIIAGHQRIQALQLLGRGEEYIDVRVPNRTLTENEYKQYLVTSNAVTGDWDFEKLKDFGSDFLIDIGFDPIDLSHLWDKEMEVVEDTFDEAKELKTIKEPITRSGDLISLGRHRLICGDSTDHEVLKRLFETDKASMIYSDPIYNIQIDYSKGVGGKQSYGGEVNDDRSEEAYRDLLQNSMEAALSVSHSDLHVFYWSDQKYIWLIQTLYEKLGINNKRVCLWIKNGLNPTPGVAFNKCYEPCTYGTIGSPYLSDQFQSNTEVLNKEIGNGNASFEDIWTVARLSGKEYEHATSKPPKLHEKAILRCTKPGDIILDSFMGSGSTLIAADQLNRRVYGVELEPMFCDLIIRRYEKLTSNKAHVISSYEKD